MGLRDLTKEALTRLGARCSPSHIHGLNAALNYMETGRWLRARGFGDPPRHPTREQLYDALGPKVGGERVLYLEFGVYYGYSLRLWSKLLKNPRSSLHGFDSFEGLPEDWRPGFPRGAFAHAIPRLRPNVSLEIGAFEETLPCFVARHGGSRAGFVHVDCDLYSSTRTVFEHCAPMIGPGTVIVFDEYFNYAGWRRHEYRAFQEFIAAGGSTYEYIGVVPAGQQVAVLVTG